MLISEYYHVDYERSVHYIRGEIVYCECTCTLYFMFIVTERSRVMETVWKKYKRKGLAEMRPYMPGEDLTHISVSPEDDPLTDCGMIARNPLNYKDQWYVARKYFEDNFEESL